MLESSLEVIKKLNVKNYKKFVLEAVKQVWLEFASDEMKFGKNRDIMLEKDGGALKKELKKIKMKRDGSAWWVEKEIWERWSRSMLQMSWKRIENLCLRYASEEELKK
ncbi:hypothetical protein NWQ33_03780 [Mycoplasmopsis cynos]|nr:hypothetical protein [Mycoplasmopsis cynos]